MLVWAGRRARLRRIACALGAVLVASGICIVPPAGAATSGAGFVSIAPCRLLDTRSSDAPSCAGAVARPAGAIGAGQTAQSVLVSPTGNVGQIPSDATAVVLNVTVLNATVQTYVTAYPATAGGPGGASTENGLPGRTSPNLTTVPLNIDSSGVGAIDFYNDAGSSDVVVDLEGYYSPSAAIGFTPISPCRAFDTRGGGQNLCGSTPKVPARTIGTGGSVTFNFAGVAGVPATATAVTLNVTAVDATGSTYVSAYPAGDAAGPLSSNLNLDTAQAEANQVIVALDHGSATFYNNSGSVNLVVDLSGWYDASSTSKYFSLAAPCRVFDSRVAPQGATCNPNPNSNSLGGSLGPGGLGAIQIPGVDVIPVGATAVVLNVTGVNATAPTYLSVFPDGGSYRPTSSSLNLYDANAVPNQVTVQVPAGTPESGVSPAGLVDFFNNAGSVDVIVDASGYFG